MLVTILSQLTALVERGQLDVVHVHADGICVKGRGPGGSGDDGLDAVVAGRNGQSEPRHKAG